MAKRIQMSRQHPWRADNPDAVRVDRNTKWGNPFRVGVNAFNRANAVDQFREMVMRPGRSFGGFREQVRTDLAGRDLACWCPLDQPRHADVLLEIANS
ncbi:DUF4326 domain-containing protein [Herbiconiux sp. KACC 21604]|nr:DUF4326 domain-containing protein [Herbiconiux sp. KACC 21604]